MLIPQDGHTSDKYFGRYIISFDTNVHKIVCADIGLRLKMDVVVSKESVYHNMYDGHYIKMFWYNNMWHYATSNIIDAGLSIYKTNKNVDCKICKDSFKTLFFETVDMTQHNFEKKFTGLEDQTHIFIFKTPKNLVTYPCDKAHYAEFATVNNGTLEEKFNSSIHNFCVVGHLSDDFINYDDQYRKKSQLLGNCPNLKYIILQNWMNEKEFIREFPHYEDVYKRIKYGKNVKDFISQVYQSYKKVYITDKANPNDFEYPVLLACLYVHNMYTETKTYPNVITYKDVETIVYEKLHPNELAICLGIYNFPKA
jgi:hypothetical protein